MNTLKTTVLMALMTGLLVVVGSVVGGKSGATMMLLISLGINFFSYWYSDKMDLKAYGAQPVSREEAPELHQMVEVLAQNANLPMPRVCVIDSPVPNAFATGRNPENGVVAVTTGIMRALNRDELAGVIAHELSHIKHRDTLISTIVASFAGAISWIAQMAQWAMIFGGRDEDEEGGGLGGMLFTMILAPIAAMIIQMSISRSREYSADEAGGRVCGNPLALASALEKIEGFAKHYPMQQAQPATSHLFIINPLSGARQIMSLFSTHPTTASRIERLRRQAANMKK